MTWLPFREADVGSPRGSEDGVVIRDEEHELGARISLERDAKTAPFAITCGIYGWMVHTRFFQAETEAVTEYVRMKQDLSSILEIIPRADDPGADEKRRRVIEEIDGFVRRFP